MSSKVLFIPGFSLEKPSNNGIIIGVKADNDPALTRWSVLEMDSGVTFDKITDVHLIFLYLVRFYLKVVGRVGLEPTTIGLKVRCSTN